MLTQFLLNLAIGIPLSAWIPYFRDGSSVISAVLTLLGFVSGIFFSSEQVPEKYRLAMELNPMTILMTAYRDIMLNGIWPNFPSLFAIVAGSIAVIMAGVVLLDRLDLSLPKVFGFDNNASVSARVSIPSCAHARIVVALKHEQNATSTAQVEARAIMGQLGK